MSHYDEQRTDEEIITKRTPEGFFQWEHRPPKDKEEERMDVIGQNGNEGLHYNKYNRELRDGTILDVYDVLDAFNIKNPAIQHALKKMLCTGLRGHKNFEEDIDESIQALERAKGFPPL